MAGEKMNAEVTKSSKGLQVYMGGGFSSLTPEQAENVAKIPQIERDVNDLKERFDKLPEGGNGPTKEDLSDIVADYFEKNPPTDIVIGKTYISPSDFEGTDTEKVQKALDDAISKGKPLRIDDIYVLDSKVAAICDGKLLICGSGTLKRADNIIASDTYTSIMFEIGCGANADIIIDGITVDGNLRGQNLGENFAYAHEHCHSLVCYPVADGAKVTFKNVTTIDRVGDGVNISSNKGYIFESVTYDNVNGRNLGIMRGDICITGNVKALNIRNCNVGHMETELNVVSDEAHSYTVVNCVVDEWLEMGTYQDEKTIVTLSDVTLKGGVLQLYGTIYANNCDLNWGDTGSVAGLYMYGGIVSNCTLSGKTYIRAQRRYDDAVQPNITIDGCNLNALAQMDRFIETSNNVNAVITIRNCVYKSTGNVPLMSFRSGKLTLANNQIYGKVSITSGLFSNGTEILVSGNDIYHGDYIFDLYMPSASSNPDSIIRFIANRVFGVANYLTMYYGVDRVTDKMIFSDDVYCSELPTVITKGTRYHLPDKTVKGIDFSTLTGGEVDRTEFLELKSLAEMLRDAFPATYTPLESIYFDGTAYLDPNVKMQDGLKLVINFITPEDVLLKKEASLAGVYDGSNNAYMRVNNVGRIVWHAHTSVNTNIYMTAETEYTITATWKNGESTIYNGDKLMNTITTDGDWLDLNMLIFAYNTANGADRRFAGHLKSAKIYVGDNLVRDLLPKTQERLGNVQTGFLDAVENKFYLLS